MIAIVQRVKSASVSVDGEIVGRIGPGVLTFLGVADADTEKDAEWMMAKIAKLRVFEDDAGKMNHSLLDKRYSHLVVSQFTLFGDCSKGNRPSFVGAGKPEHAKALYEKSIAISRALGVPTEGGRFQAHMEVSLVNDGPVTLEIRSSPEGRA